MHRTIRSAWPCTYSCKLAAVWAVWVTGTLCAVLIPFGHLAAPFSPQRLRKINKAVEYCGRWQRAANSNKLVPSTVNLGSNCFWGTGDGFCKGDAMWIFRRTSLVNAFEAKPGFETSVITTDCRFVGIDLTYYKAELQCFTGFWGNYSRPPSYSRVNLPPGQNLVVEYNAQSISVFSDGDMAAVMTVIVPLGDARQGDSLTNGAPAMYPNFSLSWNVRFTAYINYTHDNKTERPEMVPYVVGLTLQNIPMYQMYNTDCEWHAAGSVLRFTGRIALDELSMTMLKVMQGVMWALAGVAFSVTVWWTLQSPHVGREMRYDLLSFSAALLFALPAVRGLWPAAPPGGTVGDVMHIYAQLVLISFAILLQLCKYLYEECLKCCNTLAPKAHAVNSGPPLPLASSSTLTGVCTNTPGLAAAQACTCSAGGCTRGSSAGWSVGQQCAVV